MKSNSFLITLFTILIFNANADFQLKNIAKQDLDDITKDAGAAFRHASLNSTAQEHEVYDYEIGIVSGFSNSRRFNNILDKSDADFDKETVPKIAFLGKIELPKNISLELLYTPEIESSVILSARSAAIEWNFTEYLPQNIRGEYSYSIKGIYGQSEFSWEQTVSSVKNNVSYEQTYLGGELQISKKYEIFSPYATLGYIYNNGELTSSASTIFASSFSANRSASTKIGAFTYGVGTEVILSFMNVAFEFNKTFATTSVLFKSSVNF